MKKSLPAILFILFFLTPILAQVVITERIEIQPELSKKLQAIMGATAGNNTLTITYITEEDIDPNLEIKLSVWDCMGSDESTTSANGTASISYITNATYFDYELICQSGEFFYGKLYVYLNGSLMVEFYPNHRPAYDQNGGEFLYWMAWGDITLPVFIKDFNFDISGFNACYPLGIAGVVDCDIRNNTNTNVSDFSINILQDSEYIGFFQHETGQIQQNTLSCPYEELNQWYYIPLKNNYEPIDITVLTNWDGISKTSIFTLKAIRLTADISTGLGVREKLSPSDEYFLNISAANPTGLNSTSCSHHISDTEKISIETISEIEYATFYDYRSERRGADLIDLNHEDGSLDIRVYMDGPIPLETDSLMIRVSCTDSNLTDVILKKAVSPPEFVFSNVPETIQPGDSVLMEIFYPYDADSLIPFPEDQNYIVKIYKGTEYGRIYSVAEEEDEDKFTEVPGPFYFIADEDFQDSSAIVRIRMEPIEELLPCSVKPDNDIVIGDDGNDQSGITTNDDTRMLLPTIQGGANSTADQDYFPWFGAVEVKIQKSDSLDHFKVEVKEDTLAPGEKGIITVAAMNKDNKKYNLENDVLLTMTADSAHYGKFISASGDTVASPLDSVRYEDALTGKIQYLVNKDLKITSDSMKVYITAQKMDELAKNGTGSIYIKTKYNITLMIPEPAEIWPFFKTHSWRGPDYIDKKENIIVEVTNNNGPVKNQKLKLSLSMILPSGGHDHTNQPKTSRVLGYLYTENDNKNRTSIEVITDDEGKATFNYRSGVVGSDMEIKAQFIENNKEFSDTAKISVKVPSMVCLPENTSYYNKIGGTCKHHGPSDKKNFPDSCRTPDNNHWGTDTTIARIINLSKEWQNRFPDDTILEINDISVKNGGLFDIKGTWIQPHETHRNGKYFDLRSHNMKPADKYDDLNDNGKYDPPRLYVKFVDEELVVEYVATDTFIVDYNNNGIFDSDMEISFRDLLYELYPEEEPKQTLQFLPHGEGSNRHFHIQFNK